MATGKRIERRREEKRGGLSVNQFIKANRFGLPHEGRRRAVEHLGFKAIR